MFGTRLAVDDSPFDAVEVDSADLALIVGGAGGADGGVDLDTDKIWHGVIPNRIGGFCVVWDGGYRCGL